MAKPRSSGGSSRPAAKSSSSPTIPSGIKPSTLPTKNKVVQQYKTPAGPKALTPEQIRNASAGKILSATYGKDSKKEKKKKKKKVEEATLPLDQQIDLNPGPGNYDSGYSEYTFTPKSIKVPDRDAVIALQRDGADQALITSVLFEQIGATELVKFVKNDTVDGLNPQYNVISNISDLRTKLDTSYLIAKQRSDTTIDNGFSIRLQDKLPSIDYLFDNNIPNYIHFDATIGQDGSLVIELDNIDIDEIIEVEIDTNGTIVEVRQ